MISDSDVQQWILAALQNVKESEAVYKDLELNGNTIVLGLGSPFDSIAFTAFATDLEERVEEEAGIDFLVKVDEILSLQKDEPTVTVEQMARHIAGLINQAVRKG
jgi:hypothetical protein